MPTTEAPSPFALFACFAVSFENRLLIQAGLAFILGRSMDTAPSSSESMKVGYVAHLARLELTEDETARFQPQLDRILEFVRHLQSLDTGAVEPTAHAAPAFTGCARTPPAPGSIRPRCWRTPPPPARA
jgi:aspartyl-tRNA(Asn)/glutamyl-tRNA(Gln) amidotransferase subunit C